MTACLLRIVNTRKRQKVMPASDWATKLQKIGERACESIVKIGIQAEERVLPEISHLVPRVEHVVVLVCARES